jgi:hypothetical protein
MAEGAVAAVAGDDAGGGFDGFESGRGSGHRDPLWLRGGGMIGWLGVGFQSEPENIDASFATWGFGRCCAAAEQLCGAVWRASGVGRACGGGAGWGDWDG